MPPFEVQLGKRADRLLVDFMPLRGDQSPRGVDSSVQGSSSLTYETLREVHRQVFVPALEGLSPRSRRRLNPRSSPFLPRPLALFHRRDATRLEVFRREVETYLNLIFLDFGFLFLLPRAVSGLHFDTNMQYLIQRTLSQQVRPKQETDAVLPLDSHSLPNRRYVGWLLKEEEKKGPQPVYCDSTRSFEEYLDRPTAPPTHWKDQYVLLFVPGLFNGAYKSLTGYFKHNMRPFEAAGISTVLSQQVSSLAGVMHNAVAIEGEVRSILAQPGHRGKRVILIGHSKGGVDCISALAFRENRLLEDKLIAGCICIQSPYSGTPYTTSIGSLDRFESCRAMNDLSYTERRSFLALYPFHAREETIPILSIISVPVEEEEVLPFNVKKLKKLAGIPTGGLVVPKDCIIPGGMVVFLNDIDHAATVFGRFAASSGSRYHPSPLTMAAVQLLLAHAASSAHTMQADHVLDVSQVAKGH